MSSAQEGNSEKWFARQPAALLIKIHKTWEIKICRQAGINVIGRQQEINEDRKKVRQREIELKVKMLSPKRKICLHNDKPFGIWLKRRHGWH